MRTMFLTIAAAALFSFSGGAFAHDPSLAEVAFEQAQGRFARAQGMEPPCRTATKTFVANMGGTDSHTHFEQAQGRFAGSMGIEPRS